MKVVYIAHPIRGDVKENIKKVLEINRQINLEEPEVVPFAPYIVDCQSLDDNVPSERERGIKNDVELMNKGFIDEIRLYGDRISNGMKEEIKLAHKLNIEVVPMTYKTRMEYQYEKWD